MAVFIDYKSLHLHSWQKGPGMPPSLVLVLKFFTRMALIIKNSIFSAPLKASIISSGSNSWESDRSCW